MMPTVSVEKEQSDDHEQWMIVEFFTGIFSPSKSTAIVPHPDSNQYETSYYENLSQPYNIQLRSITV